MSHTYAVQLNIGKYVEKKYDLYFFGGPTFTVSNFSLQSQYNNNAPGFEGYFGANVYLPGKLQMATDGQYLYTGKTQALPENERLIANASITKSFFKEGNLKLIASANNIFNQDVNFNRSVSANSFTQTSTSGIKRYFMLTVTWDFTKFGTAPSDKK
jgi:hypothetical protein